MHPPMQCHQNALAYFATATSFTHKMAMKSTTGPLQGNDYWEIRVVYKVRLSDVLFLLRIRLG
jgi:hypothetical protein